MRNKVLIVDSDRKERFALEEILQEVVEMGGELFFTDKREDGLEILEKEHPQLVFLDANLVGENEDAWVKYGVYIVLMRTKNEPKQTGEDFLTKPLKAHQVLEKCREALGEEPASRIPPM